MRKAKSSQSRSRHGHDYCLTVRQTPTPTPTPPSPATHSLLRPALLLPLPLTLFAVPSYHIDLRGIPTGCRPLNATHTRFLSFPLVSLRSLVRFWFFQKHYSFVRILCPVTLSVPSKIRLEAQRCKQLLFSMRKLVNYCLQGML